MERRLLDYYELGDVIGEGGFGSVCAGTSRQNGDAVRAYMYQVQLSVYPLCVCTLPALLAVTNSTVVKKYTVLKKLMILQNFFYTNHCLFWVYWLALIFGPMYRTVRVHCTYSTTCNACLLLPSFLHLSNMYRLLSRLFRSPKSSPGPRLET